MHQRRRLRPSGKNLLWTGHSARLFFARSLAYAYIGSGSWGNNLFKTRRRKLMGEKILLVEADITTLAVDAIVNAANNSLLGGGGVDGAIHRAAGPQLIAECKAIGGCPTGEARITKGYKLPARHIIHTVGPVWHGGAQGEPELLANCYRSCFALAHRHGLHTIAFPAISTGVYGYPKEAAARIAVAEIRQALAADPELRGVMLVCFNPATRIAYETALNTR